MPFHDSSVQPTAWGIHVAGPGLRLASALALIAPLVSGACGGETPSSPSAAHPIAEATVETDAPPPLDAPPTFAPDATLRADARGCLGGVPRTVELYWSAASDDVAVLRYLVFLDDALAATVEPPTESAALLDVSFAAPRMFAIVAVDEAGNESSRLTTSDALAPCFAPDASMRIHGYLSSSDRPTLHWPRAEDDVGVAAYLVLRRDREVARLGADTLEHQLRRGLRHSGSAYWISIVATDEAGHKTRLHDVCNVAPSGICYHPEAVSAYGEDVMRHAEAR